MSFGSRKSARSKKPSGFYKSMEEGKFFTNSAQGSDFIRGSDNDKTSGEEGGTSSDEELKEL